MADVVHVNLYCEERYPVVELGTGIGFAGQDERTHGEYTVPRELFEKWLATYELYWTLNRQLTHIVDEKERAAIAARKVAQRANK